MKTTTQNENRNKKKYKKGSNEEADRKKHFIVLQKEV